MDLWLILPPLFVGVAIGYYDLWSGIIRKVEGPLAKFSLLLLLGLMGTKIGSDSEVLSRLGDIGLQSLTIAAASIVGSVLVLKALSPLLRHITGEGEGFEAVSTKIEVKLTVSIVLVLVAGGWLGYRVVPETFVGTLDSIITFTLGLLLLAVGISLGLNKRIFNQVSRVGWRIILLPLGIALGSIAGPMALVFFINLSPVESAAVGAGFGWYSLSGVLLTKLHSAELGAIAFLANIFRELLTFLILPLTARFLGKIVSIAPGGATTMDVTLPLLKEIGGEEIILPAFFSGAVLSSLVPLVVPLIIRI
jgi:uncharacterized membrane protein YbjE (DUF340 family)